MIMCIGNQKETLSTMDSVVVLLPQNLSVLPITCDKKLIYSLCYTCAKENQGASYNKNLVCEHDDEERSFLTTTTSIELRNALGKGDKVKRLFEILKFTAMSDTLFKSSAYRLFKIKFEASGKSYDDEAKNAEFKEQIKQRHGFEIDERKWVKNPALRTISKLYLNSLWGKLSMRTDRPETVVYSPPLSSTTPQMSSSVWNLWIKDKMYITYKTQEFTVPLAFSNSLIPYFSFL